MATYTASAGDRAVHAKTLTAATVDTVNLAKRWSRVTVSRQTAGTPGTDEIYFTIDGTTAPTVGGGPCFVLPAEALSVTVDCPSNSATVKLIATGTPTYSVVGS